MELERLIETERRNEELIRRARDEAAAIVEAARVVATRREKALAIAVEFLIGDGETTIAAERERRAAEIAAGAAADATRYDAVSDEWIAALVPHLLDRLIAGSEAA